MTLRSTESKPTVPEVLPLVQALYASEHGACGGCLHIVLDDTNIEDHHVQYCVDYARERHCQGCLALAETLLRMSQTQRKKLANHPRKYPS